MLRLHVIRVRDFHTWGLGFLSVHWVLYGMAVSVKDRLSQVNVHCTELVTLQS